MLAERQLLQRVVSHKEQASISSFSLVIFPLTACFVLFFFSFLVVVVLIGLDGLQGTHAPLLMYTIAQQTCFRVGSSSDGCLLHPPIQRLDPIHLLSMLTRRRVSTEASLRQARACQSTSSFSVFCSVSFSTSGFFESQSSNTLILSS